MNKKQKGICPKCGKPLTYFEFQLEDELGRWEVDCLNCEWAGYEWYEMKFDAHTER